MIRRLTAFGVLAALALTGTLAQESVAPPGQKSLAATLDVYAFPTKGQSPAQQSEDQAACYQYAVTQTGVDPFNLQKQAQQQKEQAAQQQQAIQQAGKGAGAAGAVAGAAGGALIGAIAHGADVGAYAAYGAAAGLLMGRRRARMAKQEAGQEVQQQSQQAAQATAQQMSNFKKAFSVCLEAKNYMVKY